MDSERVSNEVAGTTETDIPAYQRMLIEFRPSTIHGMGGFAMAAIEAGASIIEYLGQRISKADALRQYELNNRF